MTPEARPCSTLRATKIPSPCSAARGIRRLKTEARQIETPNTTFEPYVSDSAPPVSGQQACPKFGGVQKCRNLDRSLGRKMSGNRF